jgi:hypothetical protein
LKETRHYLLDMIREANLPDIKTYYTGFPFLLRPEDQPGAAVYSLSENPELYSTGYDKSTLHLAVELSVNAKENKYSHNRGEDDEDWLNDNMTIIRDLILNHPELSGGMYEMAQPQRIDYRVHDGSPEGIVRVASMTVEVRKRRPRPRP